MMGVYLRWMEHLINGWGEVIVEKQMRILSGAALLHQQVTPDPSLAGFILAHGTEALGQGDKREVLPKTLPELEEVLEQCAAACTGRNDEDKVPMIVANPDLVTVSGSELVVMPGTLAKKYKALGGTVRPL